MQVCIDKTPVPATFPGVPDMVAWLIPLSPEEYTVHKAETAEAGSKKRGAAVIPELHKMEREKMAEQVAKMTGVPMPDGSKRDFEGDELRAFLVDGNPYSITVPMHSALWDAIGNGPQNVLSDAEGKDSD